MLLVFIISGIWGVILKITLNSFTVHVLSIVLLKIAKINQKNLRKGTIVRLGPSSSFTIIY